MVALVVKKPACQRRRHAVHGYHTGVRHPTGVWPVAAMPFTCLAQNKLNHSFSVTSMSNFSQKYSLSSCLFWCYQAALAIFPQEINPSEHPAQRNSFPWRSSQQRMQFPSSLQLQKL